MQEAVGVEQQDGVAARLGYRRVDRGGVGVPAAQGQVADAVAPGKLGRGV